MENMFTACSMLCLLRRNENFSYTVIQLLGFWNGMPVCLTLMGGEDGEEAVDVLLMINSICNIEFAC